MPDKSFLTLGNPRDRGWTCRVAFWRLRLSISYAIPPDYDQLVAEVKAAYAELKPENVTIMPDVKSVRECECGKIASVSERERRRQARRWVAPAHHETFARTLRILDERHPDFAQGEPTDTQIYGGDPGGDGA